MDIFRQSITDIKSHINHILSNSDLLATLSPSDIDEVLSIKHKLCDSKWAERCEESKRVKQHYIKLLTNTVDVLQVIFHWKDLSNHLVTNIDLDSYKQVIIDCVNNSTFEFDNHNSTYNLTWCLVESGKITFTLDDVKQLNLQFIEYMLNDSFDTNCIDASDKQAPHLKNEDADWYIIKAPMKPRERFWVNVVASRYDEIKNKDTLLYCLGTDSDQRLRYMPQPVKIFTGDLLPHIVQHYSRANISPLIMCRRNLGIVLGNESNPSYEYKQFIKNGSFMCNSFTIEMPYMSYVYVDRVEIDISDFSTQKCMTDCCYVSIGDKYIMKEFVPVIQNNANGFRQKTTTIVGKCAQNNKPGYCVSVCLGLTSVCTIHAIRIYGTALSFI